MKCQDSKLVLDIPRRISRELEVFRTQKTNYKTIADILVAYFDLYLLNYQNLSVAKICLYQTWSDVERNNFSFRFPEVNYQKLTLLANSNLRSTKSQATHLVYFVYNYISK